jgi:hypothetical protein
VAAALEKLEDAGGRDQIPGGVLVAERFEGCVKADFHQARERSAGTVAGVATAGWDGVI